MNQMDEKTQLSLKINKLFSSDQDFHAEQQSDGRYLKKSGKVVPSRIKQMLDNDGSIAVYQRNINDNIKWICYDFDIIKSQLEENSREIATQELMSTVEKFCLFLDKKEIKYLLEYSGNRGIHIWITFQNEIPFKTGFDITTLILEHAELNYNSDYIAIDLFPHSNKITNSVGSCVKLPLSKHKKSNGYSFFLANKSELKNITRVTFLSSDVIEKQQFILDNHTPMTLDQIEKTFNVFLSHNDTSYYEARIKEVVVADFNLDSLLSHWESEPPLKKLGVSIQDGKLNNEERKLLVGILINAVSHNHKKIGEYILTEIFKRQKNYNSDITQKAINSLSSYYFPSKEQVENILKERFSRDINTIELLDSIFINVISFDQGFFDFCITDIEISRNAEMRYLIQNDEAQSRKVFNELGSIKSVEYLNHVHDFIDNFSQKEVKYYIHDRHEDDKVRNLISLECLERITTSMILKQIHHFFNLPNSSSTHGYKVRKGFKDGYIFEPWLYLWMKFLSNISSALVNEEYSDYYIIKTDVTSFYSEIDHDKLKRILLESSPITSIREKLLGLDEKSISNYKRLISICLDIAKKTVGADKGLPQGPAYARFFAELYLSDIDQKFENLLNDESIVLYQRYVDDIFIVCRSEDEAKFYLEYLTQELSHLGLTLKHSKTIVKKVKEFTPEYDKYRSQSKYSVDRISTKYLTATDEEKSYAIDEFIKLILSDTKQDDYSFIFSHLRGVQEVEPFKNNEIPNILESGVGRGSLFRNLFIHILENENLWYFFKNVDKFNSLQSEVLTSTIINIIEEGKSNHDKFKELMQTIIRKLTITKMVEEHLFLMNLLMGLDVDYKQINANSIIDLISSFPKQLKIETTENLLDYINTELNSMDDKYKFINVMYAITHANQINKTEITKLASVFYSFVSLHMNRCEFDKKDEDITESLTFTIKFHYLVSLFSLSMTNNSHELLIRMWKYCACLFNNFKYDLNEKIDYSWLHKIRTIEMDTKKLYLLLSSIIDGEIFRGTIDKKSIFKTYHTLLLVFLSDKLPDLEIKKIDELLKDIKSKSNFYEWIIDRDKTEFLPGVREWFDNNIIFNNTIILKRGDQVLIRKPHELFSVSNLNYISEDGYSELIEDYNINSLNSVKNLISNMDLKHFIEFLVFELSKTNVNGFPNIFSNARLLKDNSLEPFSLELYSPRNFIFEESNKSVSIKEYSKNSFVNLMFTKYAEATSTPSIDIYEKYISKLPEDIEVDNFLKYLSLQFKNFDEIDDTNSTALIDLSVASAFYSCLEENNTSLSCFDRFTEFYIPSDFLDTEYDLHVFSVNNMMNISDGSPGDLIESILHSIKLTKTEAYPYLMLNIEDGINDYFKSISRIIQKEDNSCPVEISSFAKCQIKLNQIRNTLQLSNSKRFNYSNVKIINNVTGEIDDLSLDNTYYINSATHNYQSEYNGVLYLISIPSSLSKAFDYIDSKFKSLTIYKSMSYLPYQICKSQITSLDRFEDALNVVQNHQSIPYKNAQDILVQWLSMFPERFRDIFVLIIASHQYMTSEEIKKFCALVLNRIKNKENTMMIKCVNDYNGTIRCFHTNEELSRTLASLDPNLIDDNNANDVCIVADVIISGAQICKAMNYYINEIGTNECYYNLIDENGIHLKTKFDKVRTINICCILYTDDAIIKIRETLESIMPNLLSVNIINGRSINGDAFFETTKEIGNTDKLRILSVLSNEEECRVIYNILKCPTVTNREFRKRYVMEPDDINKTNLVARFKSLPKKCFPFLYFSIKTNNDLHPMVRVLETKDNY